MGHKVLPCLTGKKIGKWSVGKLIEGAKHSIYLCVCECGSVGEIRGSHLLNGQSTQCRKCGSGTPRPSLRLLNRGVCRKGHDLSDVQVLEKEGVSTCGMCRWEGYILRTYGLTAKQYLDIFNLQKGLCAICHKTLTLPPAFGKNTEGSSKRTEIDHKHVPKKTKPQPTKISLVRGLLCGGRYAGCNAKLGHVDDVEWLKAAAAYLSAPPAQKIILERK
jgi:hypothetical protein